MKKVIVCINYRANPNNPSCGARGGTEIADIIETAITQKKLDIHLQRFECLGFCHKGPNLRFAPDGRFFYGVAADDMSEVLSELEAFTKAQSHQD